MGYFANKCNEELRLDGTTLVMEGMNDSDYSGTFDNEQYQLLIAGVEAEDSQHEFSFLEHGFVNNQGIANNVPEEWTLLDSQSTVSVFYNKKLLTNIRQCPTTMHIHCNAGVTTTKMIGDLKGFGPVWYHTKGITNIMSLSKMTKKYRVSFVSA
jgi:hypothetical protein